MKNLSLLLFLAIMFVTCTTPREALEKKHYREAFRLAKSQLRKGKDWDENIDVLRISSDEMIKMEIQKQKNKLSGDDVFIWVKVQNRYYNLLETIGAANILVDGEITEEYDVLCSAKKDLDFKIVDDFYTGGNFYMGEFETTGLKVESRNAYYEYMDCEKYGGESFFQDLKELLEESYENGIVYYASNVYFGNNLFLKELPDNADFEPDCDVDVILGFVNFREVETSSSEYYTKRIKTGENEIIDTSGIVTYEPIFEDVNAFVKRKTITLYADQNVNVFSENITGHCTISSCSFNVSVSDSYSEIDIDGDERAVPISIEEKEGEPSFFRSYLEDKLDDAVMDRLKN